MPLCEIYIRSHLGIIEGSLVATHTTFKFYLKKTPYCWDPEKLHNFPKPWRSLGTIIFIDYSLI
jgi:hypothetical protein